MCEGYQHLGALVVLLDSQVGKSEGSGELFHEGVEISPLIESVHRSRLNQIPVIGIVDLIT